MVWLVKSTHRRRGCRAPRSRSSGRLSDYGRNLTPVRACSDKSPAIPRILANQPGSFAGVPPSGGQTNPTTTHGTVPTKAVPQSYRTPIHKPEAPVLKLRNSVNREAMAGTSPGRQSGETAKSELIIPKGRQADPDKLSVVPLGLLRRLLRLDHGLASMAVTCHAFGIQKRNFRKRQRGNPPSKENSFDQQKRSLGLLCDLLPTPRLTQTNDHSLACASGSCGSTRRMPA